MVDLKDKICQLTATAITKSITLMTIFSTTKNIEAKIAIQSNNMDDILALTEIVL